MSRIDNIRLRLKGGAVTSDDIVWLLAEVERLTEERTRVVVALRVEARAAAALGYPERAGGVGWAADLVEKGGKP